MNTCNSVVQVGVEVTYLSQLPCLGLNLDPIINYRIGASHPRCFMNEHAIPTMEVNVDASSASIIIGGP